MKLLFTNIRPGRVRAIDDTSDRALDQSAQGSDSLGRGMDLALTVLVFLVVGWLLDSWLGLFPLFTISLVLFSSIGSFVRMKYVYDAAMERLEADRAAHRTGNPRLTAPAVGSDSIAIPSDLIGGAE